LSQLHFRFLGPNGNRDIAVVGEPGNPLVAYFGAASGGIWKTEDGGVHFEPIFDEMDVASVSALAIAPSDSNTIWAGTGETFIIREATSVGDGAYKSTDAGRTWRHMGLDQTGHIGNIVINPRNPDLVFACAVGQAYRANPERGVFRSKDGGKTWEQVLKVDENTGCSGLDMDEHDSQTLFAGMWQIDIKPWDEHSGGPGSGVFVTHDGGDTWTRLSGRGLPPAGANLGKIAVRVAPNNGQRVYALIQEDTARFYRSDDGGKSWRLVNESHRLSERSPYYTNFRVSPDDEDLLYFVSVAWTVSRDGGRTFAEVTSAGGDLHDVWIDPKNPNRVMVADDGGGGISLNRGKTYQSVNLPIAQLYHVTTDNEIPYNVIANRQDSGGQMGPSRTLSGGGGGRGGGISSSDWHGYAGCESGFGVPDPTDGKIIWSGCYDGDLVRVDLHTGQARNVHVWPVAAYGWTPGEARDRFNWTFPIAISPHNHKQVYVGSQYVYQTTTDGQNWKRISPDLTTNDHTGPSGGLAYDNLMTFSSATLAFIAESPVKAGVIWTGSYDGQVNVTQDGGAHWTNVTTNISGLPPYGTINLEPSKYDAGTAYVSSNLKMMGNYDPFIYKTTDYGKTWTAIAGNIPHSVLSFVHIVREDPVRKGMLYAGTENAIYISWNDGGQWARLRNNFPAAPVYWLTIQPTFNDLVIGTYGRGVWILDDVTPLRTWDQVSSASAPHLFAPRPAYRFRSYIAGPQNSPNPITRGENPPYGADINFYLNAPAPVEITITGANGATIRTLRSRGQAGLNRVWWDLRHQGLREPLLLTNPPDAPWVNTPAEGRPLIAWGTPAGEPLVVPGTYTVKLSVNGTAAGSQPLQVLADPHTLGTQQSMEAQEKFLLQMQEEVNQVVDMINHLEGTRKQLDVLTKVLAEDPKAAPVLKAIKGVEEKAVAVEGKLFDIHLTGFREDSFRHPDQLYEQLSDLASKLNGSGADMGPTDQQMEARKLLGDDLSTAAKTIQEMASKDIAALNATLKSSGFSMAIQ
jgi:photosystem II stability/assembly factor-like uncharacterized protein